MTSDNDNTKKIGGIDSSTKAKAVEKTQTVSKVDAVQAATGVEGLQAAGGIGNKRKATRIMSAQEREELLKMIDEEAEKLFKSGAVPSSKRDLISTAVKMAVDTSIVLDEDVKEE
jgi:hypothetical protein